MKATDDGQMLFGERGGDEPHKAMTTDPARQAAESWYKSVAMAEIAFAREGSQSFEHAAENLARIAADFAERLCRARDEEFCRSLEEGGANPGDPLPWAEAMKEGGESA